MSSFRYNLKMAALTIGGTFVGIGGFFALEFYLLRELGLVVGGVATVVLLVVGLAAFVTLCERYMR